MRVLIIITDVRDTDLIPMRLVIAGNKVVHIRNEQFGFLLCRIRCDLRVFAVHFGTERNLLRSGHLDIELYIAYDQQILVGQTATSVLAFLDLTLAVVIQTELLEHVHLGLEAFIYRHFDSGICAAQVSGFHIDALVDHRQVFLQVGCFQLVPHGGVAVLDIFLSDKDRRSGLAGVTVERLVQTGTDA